MKKKIDVSLENKNHLVIGTSGSGKSTWLKSRPEIKRARRLLVWDPDEEYPVTHYRRLSDYVRAVRATGAGPIRAGLSIDATKANFELWAKIAFTIATASCKTVFIAEEIADVTDAGKAGPYWGKVIRRIRKYGGTLYSVTQRPAEADKTVYSQSPYKWIGYLDNETDRARLAKLIGTPVETIGALNPLEFLYKKPGPGLPQKGKVKIPQR